MSESTAPRSPGADGAPGGLPGSLPERGMHVAEGESRKLGRRAWTTRLCSVSTPSFSRKSGSTPKSRRRGLEQEGAASSRHERATRKCSRSSANRSPARSRCRVAAVGARELGLALRPRAFVALLLPASQSRLRGRPRADGAEVVSLGLVAGLFVWIGSRRRGEDRVFEITPGDRGHSTCS